MKAAKASAVEIWTDAAMVMRGGGGEYNWKFMEQQKKTQINSVG